LLIFNPAKRVSAKQDGIYQSRYRAKA